MKRVSKKGSGKENFYYPGQLAISPNQHLYVTDQVNDRLQILTTDLKFKNRLVHGTMTRPVDVKFSVSDMFVLSIWVIFTCLLSQREVPLLSYRRYWNATLSLHSLAPPCILCLDAYSNVLISYYFDHNIKVFSPEGDLLHMIGQGGNQAGEFRNPMGIAVITVSLYVSIQIFSA